MAQQRLLMERRSATRIETTIVLHVSHFTALSETTFIFIM